jgi:hypothetical protein
MAFDWISIGGLAGGLAGVGSFIAVLTRRARADGGESAELKALGERVGRTETDIKELRTQAGAIPVLTERIEGIGRSIDTGFAELKAAIDKIAPRRVTRERD